MEAGNLEQETKIIINPPPQENDSKLFKRSLDLSSIGKISPPSFMKRIPEESKNNLSLPELIRSARKSLNSLKDIVNIIPKDKKLNENKSDTPKYPKTEIKQKSLAKISRKSHPFNPKECLFILDDHIEENSSSEEEKNIDNEINNEQK